jgi:hypothetical protein
MTDNALVKLDGMALVNAGNVLDARVRRLSNVLDPNTLDADDTMLLN